MASLQKEVIESTKINACKDEWIGLLSGTSTACASRGDEFNKHDAFELFFRRL